MKSAKVLSEIRKEPRNSPPFRFWIIGYVERVLSDSFRLEFQAFIP